MRVCERPFPSGPRNGRNLRRALRRKRGGRCVIASPALRLPCTKQPQTNSVPDVFASFDRKFGVLIIRRMRPMGCGCHVESAHLSSTCRLNAVAPNAALESRLLGTQPNFNSTVSQRVRLTSTPRGHFAMQTTLGIIPSCTIRRLSHMRHVPCCSMYTYRTPISYTRLSYSYAAMPVLRPLCSRRPLPEARQCGRR